MKRGGWWWSIPRELGVPVALGTVFSIVDSVLSWITGMNSVRTPVRTILFICGLRELRRRIDPSTTGARATARLLAVGAVLQALELGVLVARLAPVARDARQGLLEVTAYLLLGIAVAFAVTLVTAARAWRSLLGPIAVIAAAACQLPLAIIRSWPYSDVIAVGGGALAAIGQVLALLAIFARLGARVSARTDLLRAERGARRAAAALRWYIAVAVLGALAEGGRIRYELPVFDVAFAAVALATIACVAGNIAGLLGMARAEVPGLSSTALCVAAFGALWPLLWQLVRAYLWQVNMVARDRIDWQELVVGVVVAASTLAGGLAVRALAIRRRDRVLRGAVATRLAAIVAVEILQLLAVVDARPDTGSGIVALWLFQLGATCAATLALAGIYGRLAERLRLATAVDAF